MQKSLGLSLIVAKSEASMHLIFIQPVASNACCIISQFWPLSHGSKFLVTIIILKHNIIYTPTLNHSISRVYSLPQDTTLMENMYMWTSCRQHREMPNATNNRNYAYCDRDNFNIYYNFTQCSNSVKSLRYGYKIAKLISKLVYKDIFS